MVTGLEFFPLRPLESMKPTGAMVIGKFKGTIIPTTTAACGAILTSAAGERYHLLADEPASVGGVISSSRHPRMAYPNKVIRIPRDSDMITIGFQIPIRRPQGPSR